jgi:copper chaperone CopZ
MAKTISILFGLLFMSVTAFSQAKPGKAIIQTPGVRCELCKARVEKYLSSEFGVRSVKVDPKKGTTTVTWLPDRTDIETIKTAIANLGFDADDVTAEPDSYKRLPVTCQKHVQDGAKP